MALLTVSNSSKNKDAYKVIDRASNSSRKYVEAKVASEGLAPVALEYDSRTIINSKGKKETLSKGFYWGFVDSTFETIVPFHYNAVTSFSEGLAGVQHHKNRLWGFINRKGELVITFKNEFDSEVTTLITYIPMVSDKAELKCAISLVFGRAFGQNDFTEDRCEDFADRLFSKLESSGLLSISTNQKE